MKKIIILICLLTLVCGCASSTNVTPNSKNEVLDKIIKEDNYIIVDVRTKEEYASGHVVDAINIPYDEIDKDTELDKEKTIIIYCRSGKRSGIAYNTLKNLGYEVYDLGAYDTIYLDKE